MDKKKANKKTKVSAQLAHNKKRFLEHYREFCVVGKAAEAAGVSCRTVYGWIEQSKDFAALFESAKQDIVEKLEAEAIRRAHEGWDEPVFFKGQLQGTVRKYSDTLLIFLLKGNAPEKYRDRIEQTGEVKHSGTITLKAEDLSDEELAAIARGSGAGVVAPSVGPVSSN